MYPEKGLRLYRVTLALISFGLVLLSAIYMDWHWLAKYYPAILEAFGITTALLISSICLGFILAIPIGFVQVVGPRPLAWLAKGFCTIIRGTPILLQMWILYYGLGSIFPYMRGLRKSWIWPYLTEAWPYALVSLTLAFAGYVGEVLRGGFKNVPSGELEAGKAMGMSPLTLLRRIWFPRAIQRVLPTLGGEMILQLKSTPLVATIAVVDLYGIFARIRQETFIIYEPLLLLALIYLLYAGGITLFCRRLENRYPSF